MVSPARAYQNNLQERPEMKKDAYAYFLNKYFKDPFKDTGFLDTTERISAKNIKFFIPGKIYTFQYDPVHKEFLDYYDKRPIILCCGEWVAESTGNSILTGINLNFLPEIARVNTLEYYYNAVKADIDAAYKKTTDTDQVSFIKRALTALQDIVQSFNIFNKAGKIGYQFAMRNYIIGQNMRSATIIEYDDWQWIPFIQTKEIVGKSLGEIYGEYVKQRGELAQKQPSIIRQKDNKKRKYNNR